MSYLFGENMDVSDLDLYREYTLKDCRADFYFQNNDQEYLIEVKIYDRDCRYEKYEKLFPKAKKALIANYTLPPREGWEIKTWKNFIVELDKDSPAKEKNIISSYGEYLKSVINYEEIKPMDLTNISSLLDFYNLLKEVQEDCEVFVLEEYTSGPGALKKIEGTSKNPS